MEICQIADEALRANPALQSLRIIIEDYLDDARDKANAKKARLENGSAHLESKDDGGPSDEYTPVVLLVGGDDNIQAVLKLALHQVQHKLLWAQDKKGLEEALESHPPDLVVAEAQVTNAGGFQLMQMVKSHPWSAEIPVVLLSSESFLDCLHAAYSAIGASDKQQQVEQNLPA
ncbi:MAG TPA: hypothetical protein VLZ81_02160 [Blastocatellia bacterium]|nr:hypothetical protein [Blastocatellia bacterium]